MNLELKIDNTADDSASSASNKFTITVSQESFYSALALVARAVAKHPMQPVLNNVLIKADQAKGAVMLAGTDLDLSLTSEIPAVITNSGQITVPAQKLQEIISKLPKQELKLEIEETNIFIHCGRSKFEIKGLNADEFPVNNFYPEEQKDLQKLALPLDHLKKGCELVSFASDKKEVNSILNGVCIQLSEKGLEIAATDGSRLAYYQVPNVKSEITNKSIIPFKTVEELRRMISDLDEVQIDTFFSEHSSMSLKTKTRLISSNLIEGSYPKYQQLIPDGYIQRAKLNRVAFIGALERVAVLANEKSRVIKMLFEEIGVLTISANTPELGDARDQLDMVEYEGQDFSIAFNVNYMIDCLKNLDCEEIELHMSEALKPILVHPIFSDENADEFKYTYLLMPIQLRTA